MRIKNDADVRLILPTGHELEPGKNLSIPDAMWNDMRETPKVQMYLRAGYLIEVDSDFDAMSDDEIRALLVERGVEVDGRWGRERMIEVAING